MRLPPFRLRTLMIAVAVAAVLLFGTIEGQRLWGRKGSEKGQNDLSSIPNRSDPFSPLFRPLFRPLVLVAAAAVALYGLHLIRLHRDYQAIAAAHVQRGQLFVLTPVVHEGRGLTFRLAEIDSQRRQEYHAQLRRKYEHAARYPWLPVPPDPPPRTDGDPHA